MNRRESLKKLGLGTLSAGILLEACTAKTTEQGKGPIANVEGHRQAVEVARDKALEAATFFNPHELATLTVLTDIIIPADEHSGSASDAGVPAFIEFMAKDKPELQVPLRGGLRWLDMQCLRRYRQPFAACTTQQQLAMVDDIAYPAQVKPGMEPGIAFFDRVRGLTATGFFTSKMGIEDLGYVGNRPNKWEGVPEDIKRQYGLEGVGFV